MRENNKRIFPPIKIFKKKDIIKEIKKARNGTIFMLDDRTYFQVFHFNMEDYR